MSRKMGDHGQLHPSVELICGDRTLTLDTGDSAYYNSIVPHYVSCVGGEKAAIYAVLYIPE